MAVQLVACPGCNDDKPAGEPDLGGGPLPVDTLDCNTLSFSKTSQLDGLPGGIWFGELVDCQNNEIYEFVTALVTEDGRFRIIGENGHLLRGSLQTDGDTFNGYGVDFAKEGIEYFSGPTTQLFVAGSVEERRLLEGRWGTEWGFYGYFSFDYSQETYDKPTPLDSLAGVWQSHHGASIEGVWTVEPDGRLNGQDQSSCLHSGQFALIDERYSVFEVELTVTGCALAGVYTGIAYREDLVDWWDSAITLSVDDGMQALQVLLVL